MLAPYFIPSHGWFKLRDSYAAKTHEIQTPWHVSLNNSTGISSFKILYDIFRPSGQRCQNYAYIWKVTSSGRAEIKNGRICSFQDIFIFSSATRSHFSNVNILLTSLATW